MELLPEELRPEEPADTRGGERRTLGALLRERGVTLVPAGVRGFREGEVLLLDDRVEEDRGTETEGRDEGLPLGRVLTRGALLGAGGEDGRTDREEPGRGRVADGAETLEGLLLVSVFWFD